MLCVNAAFLKVFTGNGNLPAMREKQGVWSYVSAVALAGLVFFVFWALQNYGPESAVRRFHRVVARIGTYLPPEQPYDPRLIRAEDLYELSQLTNGAHNTDDLALLIDVIARRGVYLKARTSLARTDYKTARHALVVQVSRYPNNREEVAVFVVDKVRDSWTINARSTALLLRNLNSQPGPVF